MVSKRGVEAQSVVTEPVAALGMSYNIKIDDQREVVFQTHVSLDCPPERLDYALDKIAAAADRQYARYHVKKLKHSLAMQTKQLRRVTEDLHTQDERNQLAFVRAGKKGSFRLSNEQETHRANVLITQARFKEEIADIEREIAETEAIANGRFDSRPNS